MHESPNATWNIEDGYQSNINEKEVYPYRVFGSELYNSVMLKHVNNG